MTFPITATSHTLADYRARGGYAALEKALRTMQPEDVTKEVIASGLRGHGGAAFPIGRKWANLKLNDGQPHYLCANADEGEPGTFKDRWILEHAPHHLLESMLIASYALQVRNAFVYIRGEFDLPRRRLAAAVEEAYQAGYFGERILGTDFSCDVVIYRGAGSYVCGEASSLVTSIEGRKPYPRNGPPRLTIKGPVPAADGGQQRRDAREHHLRHCARRRGVSQNRHPQRARARSSSRYRATSTGRACTSSSMAIRGPGSSTRTAAAS
jgi:NADH-quinone oxidoreductase subunit F